MGAMIPATWTPIARCAHVAPGVWWELRGAPLSIKEAHKAHDEGAIFMANKRDSTQTYLVIRARHRRGMNA